MYDENGIIAHTISTSTAANIPETSSSSVASSSSVIPTVGAVSTLSDSNSPTASAASDCCSYDSTSGDQARVNSQLLLYQSLASNPSLLPLLNLAQQNGSALSRRSANSLQLGVNPAAAAAVVGQPQLRQTKVDPNMALINTSMMNVKDSRWLQVEVCREFQRGQCSRNEQECKFAHPPPHVDVQNGRVTACYDHLKGRCTRDNPKCKFLHAPQHLKDQLLLNGRNNLALKNYMTQLSAQATSILPPSAAATAAAVAASNQFTNFSPFAAVPGTGAALVPGAIGTYSPYAYALNTAAVYPGLVSATSQDALGTYGGILPTGAATSPVSMAAAAAVQQAQKAAIVRVDRVEVCREFSRGACQRGENECKYAHPKPDVEKTNDGTVVVCIDYVRKGGGEGACTHKPCRYYHPPPHLLSIVAARLAQQPNVGQQLQSAQSSQMQHRSTPSLLNGANGNGAGDPDQSSSTATAALLLAYQQQLQQQLLAMQQPLSSASSLVGHPMQMQYAHASAAATSSAALPASSATMQAAAAAQAYAASQLAAVAQHPISSSVAKKRPLEPDTVVQQISAHSAATDPLLLAAAALQSTPVNKRAALEKGGVPVFQPVTPVNAAAVSALQYPQFATAAFPGIQTSYVPVTFTAATTATHAPAPASAAAAALPGGGGAGGGGAVMAAALQQQQQNQLQQQLQALVAQQQQQQQQQSNAAQLMSVVQQQQQQQQQNAAAAASLVAVPRIPNNVASVAYFDESGQLLDTLPVCRDFKQGRCERPNCRYVHLLEDYVEMNSEGKVTVCRDFAKGKCSRVMCKYYHVPLLSPIAAATANAVLPTAAAILASSTSPFSSYLSPSSSSSPPWSLSSQAVWLQRLQQQPLLNSTATDYLNSAGLFPTVSPSIGTSTNASNFDQASYLLSQQQQALLAAQQTALLNTTAGQQKSQLASRNGTSTDEAAASGGSAVTATTSASSQERQTSPATNAGGRRS